MSIFASLLLLVALAAGVCFAVAAVYLAVTLSRRRSQ